MVDALPVLQISHVHLSAPAPEGAKGTLEAYASTITKLYGGDFGDWTLMLEVKPQWFQCVLTPFAFAAWCVGDFDCHSNVLLKSVNVTSFSLNLEHYLICDGIR